MSLNSTVSWLTMPISDAQRRQRDLARVDAVDQDAARGRLVEARNEIDERGLPRSARADERDDFALRGDERHVGQDRARSRTRTTHARTRARGRTAPRVIVPRSRLASVGLSSTSKIRSAADSDCCAVVGTCESCFSGCSMRMTQQQERDERRAVHRPLSRPFARADPENRDGDEHAERFGDRLREHGRVASRAPCRARIGRSPRGTAASSYASPPNDFTRRMPLTDFLHDRRHLAVLVAQPVDARAAASAAAAAGVAMSSGATTSRQQRQLPGDGKSNVDDRDEHVARRSGPTA